MRRAVLIAALAALTGCLPAAAASPPAALLHPAALHAKAPRSFDVTFRTTKGTFVVRVTRAWAPRGADRFYNLVRNRFYDGQKIFRVVPHFVVQFGISPYPKVSQAWLNADIRDDRVRVHNARGTMTFASAGPNTRTTQVFINLGPNQRLDHEGFAPFGVVRSGMKVVDRLFSGYDDRPSAHQGEMMAQGAAYFAKHWPKLDTIRSARVTRLP